MHSTLEPDEQQFWRISLVVYPEGQVVPESEQTREIPTATEPADVAPAADNLPENLDKVRDILFGGQMRAVEARIQNMDERLRREQELMDSLRGTLERQFAELEWSTRRELQSLAERLTAERIKRGEELQALGAEMRDALLALANRHSRLEEASDAADADIREMLLQHSTAVAAEIERLSQQLTSEMQREVEGLRADKLDVAEIANVFSDMVGRLSGDSRGAGVNGSPG